MQTRVEKFVSFLDKCFAKRLEGKTSWGRNLVMQEYRAAVNQALAQLVDGIPDMTIEGSPFATEEAEKNKGKLGQIQEARILEEKVREKVRAQDGDPPWDVEEEDENPPEPEDNDKKDEEDENPVDGKLGDGTLSDWF